MTRLKQEEEEDKANYEKQVTETFLFLFFIYILAIPFKKNFMKQLCLIHWKNLNLFFYKETKK